VSLAPEQTDAGLDGLAYGSSVAVGVGSSLGWFDCVGLGSAEPVGPGSLDADAVGPVLGPTLGAWLPWPVLGRPVVDVPRPQPDATSNPAARSTENRTVPAVSGRLGVTGQA